MNQTGNPMHVAIRADASLQIGTGHVMRCLTLAVGLAKLGAQVDFICRAHPGNLIALIEQRGFRVMTLPFESRGDKLSVDKPDHAHWLGCDWQTDAQQCCDAISPNVDWIIVDHYALDQPWEAIMHEKCARMMCIDDLADRPHDCDLLLDQSLGRRNQDYATLVSQHAKLLLGPQYALLRPEFAQWRDTSLARRENPQLRHILITMGGVDADNVTGRVLSALQGIGIETLDQITVVLGPHAPWRDYVLAKARNMSVPTRVLTGVDNMAELMTSCDLAIGAGGSTTWERCALGVPAFQIELAKNQQFISSAVQHAGAALLLGVDDLESEISRLLLSKSIFSILKSLSDRSATVADGSGVEATLEFLDWS